MNKAFLTKVKKILLAEKQEIVVLSKQDMDVDMDGDDTDEIQAKILLGIANQLNIRNAAKLVQIEDALKRIEDKSYGLCQDCEEKIPEKRLLNNPHFQTCVPCAETRETEQKQRKNNK